ncbi:hypothetical protein ACRQ5Q_09345 [Bradyrhizobium sp. PMVTL-01]|uniref:hypothetical protein n=1 Tax=Bradyrhizobium sp. PMVTL-01 TaxID=3434999 RepID=UPI003F6ECC57
MFRQLAGMPSRALTCTCVTFVTARMNHGGLKLRHQIERGAIPDESGSMKMTQIVRMETLELSTEDLHHVSGGMAVPTNEAQIIAGIKAKNFASGSIFTGNSSFGDTIDNNPNLP